MTEYETTVSFKKGGGPWWHEGGGYLDISALEEPQELTLELTDPESMEIFAARVRVCRHADKLSNASVLKVFEYESMGGRSREPSATLFLELLERIEEPEVQVNVRRDKQRFAQMKGEVLKTLLTRDKRD